MRLVFTLYIFLECGSCSFWRNKSYLLEPVNAKAHAPTPSDRGGFSE